MTKRFLSLIFLIFSNFFHISAQCNAWEWADAAPTSDSAGIGEGLAVCTDPFGNVIISGAYSTQGGPTSITFGNYTLSNPYPSGVYKAYIVKYDASGNVLWARSPIGSAIGWGVSSDASGNIYATGSFGSSTLAFGSITLTNAWSSSMYLVKYDSAGNVLWAKSSSGSGVEGRSVSAGASEYVYVSGSISSLSASFGSVNVTGAGSQDAYLVKYDQQGNAIWGRTGGGTSTDESYSVSSDPLGNAYITGHFKSNLAVFGSHSLPNSSPGSSDVFIVKYDSTGSILWSDNFGGVNDDIGNSLSADNEGNVLVTGFFSCPSLIFGTDTIQNASAYNLFVIKYDQPGNTVWARAPMSNSISQGYCIDTDPNGNAYVTGFSFSYPFNFGNLSIPNAINAGGDPMVYVKLSPNGTAICGGTIASGGDDIAAIATDNFGNVFISGDITINFYIGSTYLNNYGFENVFVAKLGLPAGLETISKKEVTQEIYPNPLLTGNNIKLTQPLNEATIEVRDEMGRIIAKNIFSGTDTGIQTGLWKPGIYFITIITGKERFSKKIVIEEL